MFWKKQKHVRTIIGASEKHSDSDDAWVGASKAMGHYIKFRTKYNLPPGMKMWRDDFALGFLDGIVQVHFFVRQPEGDKAFEEGMDFKDKVMDGINGDRNLNDIWLKIIAEEGITERGQSGVQNAIILESWRCEEEFMPGVQSYLAEHKAEYFKTNPDATIFNYEHGLIMEHFVLPLIVTPKCIHRSILNLPHKND